MTSGESNKQSTSLSKNPGNSFRFIPWRANSVTDNRFESLVTEKLDRPLGYPRLAALENSDSNLVMYRRFGYLHNRLLLHRQAEIAALEAKLDALDAADDVNSDLRFRLQSREFREGDDVTQKLLLDEIETKLKIYDNLLLLELKLRSVSKPTECNYQKLYNYMWQRKPLEQGEDSFIFRCDDFISLLDTEEGSWLDDFIESVLTCFHRKLIQSVFATAEERKKSSDLEVIYYSDNRLGTFIKMLIAFIAVALLMVPVWVLIFVHMSPTMMCLTVLLFVCAFLTLLSLFTVVKRQDIFLGGATYCAVLVVFLGTLQSHSTNP